MEQNNFDLLLILKANVENDQLIIETKTVSEEISKFSEMTDQEFQTIFLNISKNIFKRYKEKKEKTMD